MSRLFARLWLFESLCFTIIAVEPHQARGAGEDELLSNTAAVTSKIDADASKVHVVKLSDGTQLRALSGQQGDVHSVSVSSDGKLIATADSSTVVRIYDADQGTLLRTMKFRDLRPTRVCFSPDAKVLVAASHDEYGHVVQWTVDKGQLMWKNRGHRTICRSVAFTQDGRRLASCGGTSEDGEHIVNVFDAQLGRRMMQLSGHQQPVNSAAFSPDGRLLASGSDDKTVRLWAVSGKPLQTFDEAAGAIKAVAFTPDGSRLLALGSDETRVHDVKDSVGQVVRTLPGGTALAVSPTGKTLAIGGHEHVSVYGMADGKQKLKVTVPGRIITSVVYTPDGESLVVGERSINTDN